jgi:hypothetical protein
MSDPVDAKPKKKRRRKVTNVRGGKPTDDEVTKMTALGYVTVGAAARAVKRAASSIYQRIERGRIPQVDPKMKPVVKTASGNVWVFLASVKAFSDPVALATGKPGQ